MNPGSVIDREIKAHEVEHLCSIEHQTSDELRKRYRIILLRELFELATLLHRHAAARASYRAGPHPNQLDGNIAFLLPVN